MSNVGLFVMGSFVTLLVLVAMTIMIWAAILDGRHDDEQRELTVVDGDARSRERPAA